MNEPILDRSVPPQFHTIEQPELIEAREFTLENGNKLHFINAGVQPVVRMEVIFQAGKRSEQRPGISYFTGKMLSEGTESYSSAALSDFFDGLGAFLTITPGFDFITLTIHALNKHLEELLPVLREMISAPAFGENELENLKQIKLNRLQVDLEKNNFIASRKLREHLFNGHPYGKSLKAENIQEITSDDTRKHYKHSVENSFEIVISGLVKPKDMDRINSHLGSIIPSGPTKSPETEFLPYQPHEEIINRESSLQSTIRLGKPTLSRDHQDYFKLVIANEILGGYFGSRLMKNIREEKGYTYGIHSSLNHLLKGQMMVIGAEVKKEFRDQTVEEIWKEVNKLQHEPVPKEELVTVCNYLAGSYSAEIDTPFALADKFKQIYFSGLGYEYYHRFFQSLQQTTPEDIMEISQVHLQPSHFSKVMVG